MASVAKRPDGQWRARYRDSDGHEHARHFPRKVDAERWVAAQRVSVDTGQHVDPRSGRTTLAEYADRWRSAQVHRPSTAALVDSQLRLHVLPQLGARQLVLLRRSEVQAWVRGRSQVLAPATTRQVYRLLATILRSAVEDRMLTTSPCVRIAMPSRDPGQVEPLFVEQVEALVGAAPARYQALIVLMSGTGLRPGEAFAVSTDRVDFLRRRLYGSTGRCPLSVVRRHSPRRRQRPASGRCRCPASCSRRSRPTSPSMRQVPRGSCSRPGRVG